MKSGVFLVAFCARLKTYGALFGDKNHKAFSRFCLCGHEKSGLAVNTGHGRVTQEGVKTVSNLKRYTATVRTPVEIVFNGNVDRAPKGYVETDVIRVQQKDRIAGYAIHAIRLSIKN